jgi:hypothetical protein
MAETRQCERCGRQFEPKREHARFCSARCRVAWNRENLTQGNTDQQKWGSENWADEVRAPQRTGSSALSWAITAMRDTIERLGRARAGDPAQAFAVIGEAVWWVTIVDATLVRYYPDEYDAALSGLPARLRREAETTFGGLRFVRNRMGYYADQADFIQPCASEPGHSEPGHSEPGHSEPGHGAPGSSETGLGRSGDSAPITQWTWRSLPPPAVATLPPQGQEWELRRYRAYQDLLAGHTIGETFSRTSAFHDLVSATARMTADPAAG